MDRVARELKLDRAEVRRRNLIPAEKMPYTKPLKARSGASDAIRQRRLSGLPGRGAARPPAGTTSRSARPRRARRAAIIGIGLAHGIKGTGRGPFESGLVRVSQHRPRHRCSPAPPRSGRASAPRWRRSARASSACAPQDITVVAGDTGGVSLGLGALRQPADRDRRLLGAARREGGRRQGEEAREPRAGSRRARSRTRRRRGARGRRAAACGQARRARAHPQGRARLRLPARRRARPRSQRQLPHRRARLCQRLPRRRGRGRRRDRRRAHPALRRAAGLRRADQSDDGRRPGAGRRRARHRQRAARMDGLRRRRPAGDHDVRRLSAADARPKCR